MTKSLVIVGSTGSIGRSALEVVESRLPKIRVVGLAAGRNFKLLSEQIKKYKPIVVAVSDDETARDLKKSVGKKCPDILTGIDGLRKISATPEADTVLLSVAGSLGVWPAWEAVRAKKRLALATKEALVLLGSLLTAKARRCGAELIPVDSEHSALFQLIQGVPHSEIKALWLGASGGPFWEADPKTLDKVTPAQALAHPVWKMGKKVTIDSATLMNKGLEIIEARWLFDVPQENVKVVIHPQGFVHAMVETIDGTMLMHAGAPDMKSPIAYALSYPKRTPDVLKSLDLAEIGKLVFHRPDAKRFPCLELARRALDMGGTAPAALNAADEIAVEAFLQGEIKFTDIPKIIEKTLKAHKPKPVKSPEDALEADRAARQIAGKMLK